MVGLKYSTIGCKGVQAGQLLIAKCITATG
jgi:hypothetical protein